MSQISKYKLNSRVYERIFSLFPQFLYRMTSKGKQQELIDTFFTRTEKIMIAKRIAIAFMLVKGYKYDEIVNKIKVSHGTVAKIVDSLKMNNEVVINEFEHITKEESFTEFLNSIGYQLSKALPPKGRNWSVWRRKIEQERTENTKSF